MIRTFRTAICIVCLLCAVSLSGAFAAEHEEHHPEAGQDMSAAKSQAGVPSQAMPEMMKMMEKGKGMMEMMSARSCTDPAAPSAKLHMMEGVLSGRMSMEPGMMRRMMDREFFLDQVDELGLNDEQVSKLTAIRNACRKDNIRAGAELKILRFDLDDLLNRADWSLPEAERLIRKKQTLEGDMLMRHLQAVAEARKVLSAEQLKKAATTGREAGLKELFE